MQFKVPQNIDMEDKIVGPLTLIQFLYLLGGGLIVYILFQTVTSSRVLFIILALPIAVLSVGMAFVKIQDQPLSHFVKAGIYYFTNPKVRFWKKEGFAPSILIDPPKSIKKEGFVAPKQIEKSDLEKLAHVLDTGPLQGPEKQNFGSITSRFEKIIQQGLNQQKTTRQGGQVGIMGQNQPSR